jgi:hypothetical protein
VRGAVVKPARRAGLLVGRPAPALELDLEQRPIIDRADPLVSGLRVSEALGGLG